MEYKWGNILDPSILDDWNWTGLQRLSQYYLKWQSLQKNNTFNTVNPFWQFPPDFHVSDKGYFCQHYTILGSRMSVLWGGVFAVMLG